LWQRRQEHAGRKSGSPFRFADAWRSARAHTRTQSNTHAWTHPVAKPDSGSIADAFTYA
jgi:hypothetical protein